MSKERTKEIQQAVSKVYGIQAKRQATGLHLTTAELQALAAYPGLHGEIQDMIDNQIRNMDVTSQVQRRVEASGGDLILFERDEDLNALFSNPCPGVKKELRIRYLCVGSDADLSTTSEELTTRGFQRNTITHMAGEVSVHVVDDAQGRGYLQERIHVMSQKAFPLLDVVVAKYGPPGATLKMKDVTTEIRRLVLQQGGWRLQIPIEANLDELLGKTYCGERKKLVITYMLRGLVGVFRCDEVGGFIRSHVKLGYPTVDDDLVHPEDGSDSSVTRMERNREVHADDLEPRLQEHRRYEIAAIDVPLSQPRCAVHRYCQVKSKGGPGVSQEERYGRKNANLAERMRRGGQAKARALQSGGPPPPPPDAIVVVAGEASSGHAMHDVKKSGGPRSPPPDFYQERDVDDDSRYFFCHS